MSSQVSFVLRVNRRRCVENQYAPVPFPTDHDPILLDHLFVDCLGKKKPTQASGNRHSRSIHLIARGIMMR
jgi:hypothetical protein